MDLSSPTVKFVLKIVSIGIVFVMSLVASFFVQAVVQDRIANQAEIIEANSGDVSKIRIYGKVPGFDETGVSVYRMVDRVVKYAILFIALTFIAFFLTEVIYRLKLHPIQYLLVGFGLAEFYLLFLALMEHIGFFWGYVIAAVMTITLISLYSRFMLGSKKGGVLIAILLSIIYAYLLIILNLETYALLSGALLLFIVLSAIMYITRNIDWYDAFGYGRK